MRTQPAVLTALTMLAGLSLWSATWRADAADTVASAALVSDEALVHLQGPGPYHQLSLPWAWQARSHRSDLGDLRVRNAQGEFLPYAWAHDPDAPVREQTQRLPLFRWGGPASGPASAASAQTPAATATPVSPSWPIWLIDLRPVKGVVHRLHLALPDATTGLFALAVEASDDLQHWRTISGPVQLVSLQHEGQALRQEDIELPGWRSAYLRLRLLPGSAEPVLKDVQVVTADTAMAPAHHDTWSDAIRPTRCDDQGCDYPVPDQWPLTRVQLMLTAPNTVLALQVQAQGGPPWPRRHGVRGHVSKRLHDLHDLRHRRRGDDDDRADDADVSPPGWQWLAQGRVHWVVRPDGVARSDDLSLPGSKQKALRLSSVGAPWSGWRQQPPSIRVATPRRSLVFLARGQGPYRLSWATSAGGSMGAATAIDLADLMPAVPGQAGAQPDQATVVWPVSGGAEPVHAPVSAAASQPKAGLALPKAWWLWGGLLLGVGLMAWMARSVLMARPKP